MYIYNDKEKTVPVLILGKRMDIAVDEDDFIRVWLSYRFLFIYFCDAFSEKQLSHWNILLCWKKLFDELLLLRFVLLLMYIEQLLR